MAVSKFTKNLVLAGMVTAIALLLAEVGLRMAGARPGTYILSKDFKVVDSPFLYKNYITDEAGIYKLSPWVSDTLWHYFISEPNTINTAEFNNTFIAQDKLDQCMQDFVSIQNPKCCRNFSRILHNYRTNNTHTSLLKDTFNSIKKNGAINTWQQAILKYVNHPFNTDGFRSIGFNNDSTDKLKVLLIGDSYVFGYSASPFHASFSDNLLAKGYMIYAAGIPGTDPAQYAAIAQKYIPIIKPDIVVMCFYEGNDYMPYNRTPQHMHPHEYMSNAGFFISAPHGEFMDFTTCYRYYKSLLEIPNTQHNAFNSIMAKSALTSLTWGGLLKANMVKHPIVEASNQQLLQMQQNYQPEFTARHIHSFDTACRKYNTPVLYTVIAQRDDVNHTGSEDAIPDTMRAQQVFGNIPFQYCRHTKRKLHYQTIDSHFNNEGHLVFTNFLDTLLKPFALQKIKQ